MTLPTQLGTESLVSLIFSGVVPCPRSRGKADAGLGGTQVSKAPASELRRVQGEQRNLVPGPRPESAQQVQQCALEKDPRPDPRPPISGLELELRPHGRERTELLDAEQRQPGGLGDGAEELGGRGRDPLVSAGRLGPGEVTRIPGALRPSPPCCVLTQDTTRRMVCGCRTRV